MSNVRFIGCLHLGHKWMATHRGFQDEFYYQEHLIKEWNKTVNKKDLTYILGDVTMESKEHYYILDQLKGRKIVVMGNHDLHQHVKELLNYVESVAGMIDYKGFCLTHCPIHPDEIGRYRGNIHAHIHENELTEVISNELYRNIDSKPMPTLHKYFNVDAKLIDYKPKTLAELINKK